MLKRMSLIVTCFAMLFMTVGARADELNKKTTVTFSGPVVIPGAVLPLPAGTYVFKLIDTNTMLNLVQVTNAENNKVMATFFGIPSQRIKASDKTYIGLEERITGLPEAMNEWFYPADIYGLEFSYR